MIACKRCLVPLREKRANGLCAICTLNSRPRQPATPPADAPAEVSANPVGVVVEFKKAW